MSRSLPHPITGLVVLAANPCTTEPCLPGMAYAVETTGGERYFVTQNGRFCTPDSAWPESAPGLGEHAVVGGSPQQQRDTTGRVFRVVELSALRYA